MAPSAKDIQFRELKDTISQLNTTIRTQNDLILSLQRMLEERNARNDGKDRRSSILRVEVDTLTEEQKHCPVCQSRMVPIGHEEIRTEIRYTRAKLERVVYIATTYGCPVCKETEEQQFIKDEELPALIPGSYASSSLVSHIMYGKYAEALPLYRQEKGFELLSVSISRTTMAGWIITCARDYLQLVYNYFHRQLLERHFLMADETPIQVLKELDRRPQSKSYVWLTRSGEDRLPPIILYHDTETRAGGNAAGFLEGIDDGTYVMVDGYSGYNRLKKIRRCCCYAHIRRYLIEAIPNGHDKDYSRPAVQGVLYCNKLFEYERGYKAKGLSYTQIYKRRLKDEKPVVEGFIRWLDAQRPE